MGSTITKQKKNTSHVKCLVIFYWAAKMGSTITKPKKPQIQRKISFYFLLGGEKWVLPSRSRKNHKSHEKFLYNGDIYHHEAKENYKSHVNLFVIFYWAAKNGFHHHEAKKTTNHT